MLAKLIGAYFPA